MALRVQFVEFDFKELYYKVREEYPTSEHLEQWFDEGDYLCHPKAANSMSLGPALTIEKWTHHHEQKRRYSDSTDQYVLAQVVHIMPLRINGDDGARLVLHELAIVAWDCIEDWTPYKPTENRFLLKRREENQFLIVLDRWISHASLHVCRKGHLGLLFERSMFELMAKNSKELMSKVQDEVDRGTVIQLGRTEQEISKNLSDFHKARAVMNRVFELVDVAIVVLKRETSLPAFQESRMFITDELSAVKPPPMTSSDYED